MKNIKKKKKSLANWVWLELGSVLLTSVGGTPDTTLKEYWDNGDVPWINSGALKDSLILKPTTYITRAGLYKSSAKLLPPNTLLVALTGGTLGKVGILGLECSTNQSVTGIYPSMFLEPKYLFYYFLYIRKNLIAKAIGSAQPHINKKTIDDTIIPIAPLAHQRKIVFTLDEIYKTISDAKIKAIEIESLEDKAFEGFIYNQEKLYPGTQIGNFCRERIERIGTQWKNKRLVGVSKELGIVDLRLGRKKTFEKYKMVYPGDFIYNPMRINIGSIAIYDGKDIVLTSPDYVVFKIEHKLSGRLLLKYLKSDIGINQINNNTTGSVRSRLYFLQLAKISIPFCGDDCQIQAELVLGNFEKMKQQTKIVLGNIQEILTSSFQKCFTEKNYDNIKYNEKAEEIVALMKREKKENSLSFKIANEINIETMNKNKKEAQVPLIDNIKKQFGQQRFTFESLSSFSKLQYDVLKDQIFDLMDKQLTLEFDKKEERMYIKIKNL